MAGAAGVARGATFGLSDQVLTKTGAVDKETLAKLQRYNPNISMAGEIGGAIAPLLLTGGTSAGASAAKTGLAIGKAARAAGAMPIATAKAGLAIERGLAGTGAGFFRSTLAKGAGAAAEGALYGAGHIVSEEALGDTELTAEHVIGSIGLAALVGGAVGSGFGVAESAVKLGSRKGFEALKKKLDRKGVETAGTVSENLERQAKQQAFKFLNGTRSKVEKLKRGPGTDELEEEIGEALLRPRQELNGDSILSKNGSLQDTYESIQHIKDISGKRIGESLEGELHVK